MKENKTHPILITYAAIALIVTVLSFIKQFAENDILFTFLVGGLISILKGVFWPITIWFIF